NEHTWKNAKHRQQWHNTLSTYVFPLIGELPVQAVDLAAVVKLLTPIWNEKAETARRVRSRVEKVIRLAIAAKAFSGDNPAARRDDLKALLGEQTDTVKHHVALPYDELPTFMAKLRAHDGIGGLPLEFCILTATRTDETLAAPWEEIDWDKRLWNIPGRRRKGKQGEEQPLTVPLSDRCMEILTEMAERTGKIGLI